MFTSSVGNAFDNDPTLKEILAATYTSSRQKNYAVINGASRDMVVVAEELLEQGFNLFLIGKNQDEMERVNMSLRECLEDKSLSLNIENCLMSQQDWSDKDKIKSLEDSIEQLEFPCLLINNYRFYSQTFTMPTAGALGVSSMSSPSMILYQSMMKNYPCTLVAEIVGKYFYSQQKARGVDFGDKIDASKYQALDSLVLQKTNSGKKKAMKKLALLDIKEAVKSTLDEKSVSEQKFLSEHHEFWRTDDGQEDEEEKNDTKESNEEFMEVVEVYTAHEEKIWDCYQLF
jgi:hypothetical protein